MREVTESAVWDVHQYVNIKCLYYKSFNHISAFSKLTSDYSFAHRNGYRELAIDCTERLSALNVHILKMCLAGQNSLVSWTSWSNSFHSFGFKLKRPTLPPFNSDPHSSCRDPKVSYGGHRHCPRRTQANRWESKLLTEVICLSWWYSCYQVFVRHFTACYNNVLACGWLFTCMKLVSFAVCYL